MRDIILYWCQIWWEICFWTVWRKDQKRWNKSWKRWFRFVKMRFKWQGFSNWGWIHICGIYYEIGVYRGDGLVGETNIRREWEKLSLKFWKNASQKTGKENYFFFCFLFFVFSVKKRKSTKCKNSNLGHINHKLFSKH